MLPVKNRRDREEKSVPPVFFLPVGEMKKLHRKRAKKKLKKTCKKFHCISGNKMLYYKTKLLRVDFFLTHKKKIAFQKFTTENSPYTGR